MLLDLCYILFMDKNAEEKQKDLSIRSEFPKDSFEEALQVAQAIEDKNSGNPLPPQEVAIAINRSPGSSAFRILLSSSNKYGLTTGSFNTPRITITDLGKDIVEPKDEQSSKAATENSVLKPEIFSKVFNYYRGKKVPDNKSFFANTLTRDFDVPKKHADIFVKVFMANIKYLGLIKDTTTGPWFASEVSLSNFQKQSKIQDEKKSDIENEKVKPLPQEITPEPQRAMPTKPNAIFLGHGKNQKPLNQLIKILDEYRIPHKEATVEPNAGRPIPTKVADTMHQCGAAILIFTADEKFTDEKGNEIWRPSENVAHELGAASVLYDNRIVIFKEDGVSLASNFSGIGYINFEKDKLNDKGVELFRELVSFKIVNITISS